MYSTSSTEGLLSVNMKPPGATAASGGLIPAKCSYRLVFFFTVIVLVQIAGASYIPNSLYKSNQAGESWGSFCRGLPDGLYPELSSGCRLYYFCYHQTAFISRCPPGTTFDQTSGVCSDANPRRCASGRPNSYDEEVAVRVRACAVFSSGVFADRNHQCKKYFACAEGQFLGTKLCGSGSVFDENVQMCVKGSGCVRREAGMRRQQRQVKFGTFLPDGWMSRYEEFTRQLEDRLNRREKE